MDIPIKSPKMFLQDRFHFACWEATRIELIHSRFSLSFRDTRVTNGSFVLLHRRRGASGRADEPCTASLTKAHDTNTGWKRAALRNQTSLWLLDKEAYLMFNWAVTQLLLISTVWRFLEQRFRYSLQFWNGSSFFHRKVESVSSGAVRV